MKRTVTSKIYIFSFAVAALIFSLGLTIGLVIENERLQVVDKLSLSQEVDLRSLQLQQTYIESDGANCDALNEILETNIADLSEATSQIIDYNKKAIADDELFDLQLREYFLTEIQFLLLSDEIKEECDTEAVTIIYFYNENEYDVQGDVLGYLKNLFGNKLMVFSFDSNFNEEPMIEVLMKSYNVTEFPTVIADDFPYYGGADVDELKALICYQLNYDHDECL